MYGFFVSLLQPFGFLMWGTAIGLTWRWFRRPADRAGLRLPMLLFFSVFAFSLPVTAWLTSAVFEWHFPRVATRPDSLQAIVVLGGGAIPPGIAGGRTQPEYSSLVRAQRAAEVYHAGPPCPLIVSGGDLEPAEDRDTPGRAMLEFLRQSGVADGDLILEEDSGNTAQNAEFTARILREKGWTDRVALVTSASHLWRATRMFEKQNIRVIPIGCDYQQDQINRDFFLFWPRASAVAANQAVFHEVVGLCLALLRGQI